VLAQPRVPRVLLGSWLLGSGSWQRLEHEQLPRGRTASLSRTSTTPTCRGEDGGPFPSNCAARSLIRGERGQPGLPATWPIPSPMCASPTRYSWHPIPPAPPRRATARATTTRRRQPCRRCRFHPNSEHEGRAGVGATEAEHLACHAHATRRGARIYAWAGRRAPTNQRSPRARVTLGTATTPLARRWPGSGSGLAPCSNDFRI
jgi:hypothetical protein